MAAASGRPTRLLLRQLLNPRLTDGVLDLLGERGKAFDPLLHHTVNATIVRGGEQINVCPSAVTVELDGLSWPLTPSTVDSRHSRRWTAGRSGDLE